MKKTIKIPIEADDIYEAGRIFEKYLDIRGYVLRGEFTVHHSEEGKFHFTADITDGYETK